MLLLSQTHGRVHRYQVSFVYPESESMKTLSHYNLTRENVGYDNENFFNIDQCEILIDVEFHDVLESPHEFYDIGLFNKRLKEYHAC